MTMDEASNDTEAGRQRTLSPLLRQTLTGAALLSATAAMGGAYTLDDRSHFLVPALIFSHSTLLAIWIAWTGRASPWRFAIIYAAHIVGLAAWHCWETDALYVDDDATDFVWITGTQIVLASLAFFFVRFLGVEISRPIRGLDADGNASRQWFQFSLAAMLEWTTAVAVVLAASHYLPDWPWHDSGVFGFLGTVTILSTCTLWTLLGTRWWLARTLALFAAATAALGVFWWLGVGEAFWDRTGFIAIDIVYLTIPLGVVRWLGYRLVWRRRVWI
jgi:hypothetical protein